MKNLKNYQAKVECKRFFILRVSGSGMKILIRALFAWVVGGLVAAAFGAENEKICIKYRKNYGWSKGYTVEGTVMRGSDLNRAVKSFSRFNAFSTYVVVFWDDDEARIFELPHHSFGRVPLFEMEVEDQEGRKWRMKKGHFPCF